MSNAFNKNDLVFVPGYGVMRVDALDIPLLGGVGPLPPSPAFDLPGLPKPKAISVALRLDPIDREFVLKGKTFNTDLPGLVLVATVKNTPPPRDFQKQYSRQVLEGAIVIAKKLPSSAPPADRQSLKSDMQKKIQSTNVKDIAEVISTLREDVDPEFVSIRDRAVSILTTVALAHEPVIDRVIRKQFFYPFQEGRERMLTELGLSSVPDVVPQVTPSVDPQATFLQACVEKVSADPLHGKLQGIMANRLVELFNQKAVSFRDAAVVLEAVIARTDTLDAVITHDPDATAKPYKGMRGDVASARRNVERVLANSDVDENLRRVMNDWRPS